MRIITIGALESFVVVILVLFLGKLIRHFIKPLRTYNIPEPIIGGLVVAVFQTILRSFDIGIAFTLPFTDVFMLMFFSTVGLGANFRLIRKGGAKVFIFLAATVVFIILQDTLGVLLAAAMGRDPLIGLLEGSITLTGAHATGAAWAHTYRSRFGIEAR
ncbi:MAG: sodium/glutamate symporter, partial [Spirochaetales bacterium]|nr:sodium/glutamate symporter [Spirochaetales bacterium]